MRRYFTVVGLILTLVSASKAQVVINEVYPGGGSSSSTAAYHTDYIELFNKGGTSVDMSGFTLAYGSSAQPAGTFPTAIGTFPSGTTLAPGAYFLVRTGSAGTGGAADPTADFVGSSGASLSATNGAVRLADSGANVLDVVGWGTTNNFETAPAAAPPNIGLSLQRFPNGTDSNNNLADFQSLTPTPSAANVPVPEPSTLALMGCSSLVMWWRRRQPR